MGNNSYPPGQTTLMVRDDECCVVGHRFSQLLVFIIYNDCLFWLSLNQGLVSPTYNKNTILPRITTLIPSSEIVVERKRRKAKIKKPLKCIKTWLMSSNWLRTHHPAKILHKGGHFRVSVQQKMALKHSREPF